MERLGAGRADTMVGAGQDDAAVLRMGSRLQLATIDVLVDGTHFRRDAIAGATLGRRLAAVNLSDVAAMGGRPTHALASLVAPEDLRADYALDLVDGLVAELARFGADLVGGNVSRGDRLVLDLAVLGEVDEECLLLRSTARPGDVVLVTGTLGAAAAARAWRAACGDRAAPCDVDQLTLDACLKTADARLDTPEPRLAAAPLLRPGGATAGLDVSDGLAADLGHLCDRSGVGARLEAALVPVDPAAVAIAAALGADAMSWALGGGEDYELLVAADPNAASNLADAVRRQTGLQVTRIGALTRGSARTVVMADGDERELAGGWRHFG